jgi:YebC/PmpR family DNA-binding regulatory protein
MSGHSKWSTIKRQKGANDAKRGALFTKLAREIITAARQGGPDPDANYRLRMAIEKARSNSMPADNIKRAIERATGGGADAEQFEEITYEGIGPGNVAVIVAAMTDNRNRTASEIRSAFNKSGGTLSTVAWQFEQRGVIRRGCRGCRQPGRREHRGADAARRPRGGAERAGRGRL